jgi:ribosome-associated translation inhibitor RaiA
MQVHVSGSNDSINPQARAYAEYRVFEVLARHRHVLGARVALRRIQRSDDDESVVCTINIELEPRGRLRTRASASHAYAAVDRAVKRTADLMREYGTTFRRDA